MEVNTPSNSAIQTSSTRTSNIFATCGSSEVVQPRSRQTNKTKVQKSKSEVLHTCVIIEVAKREEGISIAVNVGRAHVHTVSPRKERTRSTRT